MCPERVYFRNWARSRAEEEGGGWISGLFFGKRPVGGFNRLFVESTRLEEKAIFLSEGLAFFEGVCSVAFFGEALFSEGVGGQEAVGPGVPVGGVVVIGGVVHHGDGDGFALGVGAVVADPACPFAPGVLVDVSFGVGDVTFGDRSFVTEGGGNPDGKGAFFGVPEGDISHRGKSGGDIELKGAVAFLDELISAGFF